MGTFFFVNQFFKCLKPYNVYKVAVSFCNPPCV